MQLGESLDVHLVEHRGAPVHQRSPIVLPVEGVGDDHGPQGVLAAVGLVALCGVADGIEHRIDLEGEE